MKPRSCKECGSTEHDRRNCPTRSEEQYIDQGDPIDAAAKLRMCRDALVEENEQYKRIAGELAVRIAANHEAIARIDVGIAAARARRRAKGVAPQADARNPEGATHKQVRESIRVGQQIAPNESAHLDTERREIIRANPDSYPALDSTLSGVVDPAEIKGSR